MKVEGPVKTTCTHGGLFSCLMCYWVQRRNCKECGESLGSKAQGSMCLLTMANTTVIYRALLDRGGVLPPPDLQIFYNSGLKNGTNGYRTFYSDCGSIAGFLACFMCRLCACRGCAICCGGGGRSPQISATSTAQPTADFPEPLSMDREELAA